MKFEDVLGAQVLLLDGAMGTMVQNLMLEDSAFGGPAFKMLTDLLIFSRPDDLEGIHLKYLQAGANLIETNTFGASPCVWPNLTLRILTLPISKPFRKS